jgi:cytochrome c oxidase cbb3-type subunit 2
MNYMSWIFVGVFFTFASSWLALVFFPDVQLHDLQAQVDTISGDVNPAPYTGSELEGRQVYIREGCLYCHSQQIRGGNWNADLKRGWGIRRSHPVDYIHDAPQLLGTMRTGPDLSNIGVRQSSVDWHLKHLYNPQITSPGSIMPPYPWLFQRVTVEGAANPRAMDLPDEHAPTDGRQVVPTREALDLVAYLVGLRQDYEIQDARRRAGPSE